jgi:hypothetical protein
MPHPNLIATALVSSLLVLASSKYQGLSAFAKDLPACVKSDCNCDDFSNWQEAKQVFDAFPDDRFGLDRDGDGIPCEHLPNAPEDGNSSSSKSLTSVPVSSQIQFDNHSNQSVHLHNP